MAFDPAPCLSWPELALRRDKFCIMIIVMSGYGHFQVNTPAGPGADNRKPNSTGMDFVIKCVSGRSTAR